MVEAGEGEKDEPKEKGGDAQQQADPDTEKMINTLRRTDTAPSLASDVLKEKAAEREAEAKTEYGFFYAFGRMARINRDAKWLYLWGCLGAAVSGMVFPVFGIIYGESRATRGTNYADTLEGRAMEGFQLQGQALRVSGGCTSFSELSYLLGP